MKEWLKAESPADVGRFYDAKYAAAGTEALSRGHWEDMINALILHGGPFDRKKSLLDAGCGHGEFLNEVCDDLDCIGIDVSAAATRLASARLGEDAEIIHMAMEDLGALYHKFDYVVSFGAIEHTMNPKRSFENLFNLLKPGGILLVTVPLEFEDSLRYIRGEANQKTNERFADASEWLTYFGNRQEAWFIIDEGEMRDLAIIVRKEKT